MSLVFHHSLSRASVRPPPPNAACHLLPSQTALFFQVSRVHTFPAYSSWACVCVWASGRAREPVKEAHAKATDCISPPARGRASLTHKLPSKSTRTTPPREPAATRARKHTPPGLAEAPRLASPPPPLQTPPRCQITKALPASGGGSTAGSLALFLPTR